MSGTSGENPRRWTSFDPDNDIAPYVRPWNAPRKAMTRVRPVWKRASFSAASNASAPLLVKKTRLADGPGADSASRWDREGRSGPRGPEDDQITTRPASFSEPHRSIGIRPPPRWRQQRNGECQFHP